MNLIYTRDRIAIISNKGIKNGGHFILANDNFLETLDCSFDIVKTAVLEYINKNKKDLQTEFENL